MTYRLATARQALQPPCVCALELVRVPLLPLGTEWIRLIVQASNLDLHRQGCPKQAVLTDQALTLTHDEAASSTRSIALSSRKQFKTQRAAYTVAQTGGNVSVDLSRHSKDKDEPVDRARGRSQHHGGPT